MTASMSKTLASICSISLSIARFCFVSTQPHIDLLVPLVAPTGAQTEPLIIYIIPPLLSPRHTMEMTLHTPLTLASTCLILP